MKFFKQKVNDCSAYNFAEVHQFPRNSVMKFSEYLQWDMMAHWPRFLRHPVTLTDTITMCCRIQVARSGYMLTVSRRHNYYSFMSRSTCTIPFYPATDGRQTCNDFVADTRNTTATSGYNLCSATLCPGVNAALDTPCIISSAQPFTQTSIASIHGARIWIHVGYSNRPPGNGRYDHTSTSVWAGRPCRRRQRRHTRFPPRLHGPSGGALTSPQGDRYPADGLSGRKSIVGGLYTPEMTSKIERCFKSA